MILNNIEVKIYASMKLIDAYNSIFPEDFIMENVIYCIHNEINGKNYIGQTVKVENRFSKTYVGHFRDYDRYISGELRETRALYHAWKKYGLESFSVFIIDPGINREDLHHKEIYWIKTLHTCTKDPECFGYNLSWGADDMGVKDPDSIRRSLETRKKIYGDYFPNCHTQEAYDKGNKTKEEKYGHGGFINVFTPEANEKRKQTNIKKFGSEKGTLVQIWENNMKKYGDKLGPANLPENRKKGNFNRKLNLCLKRIRKIISSSDEEVTTWDQYKVLIPLNFAKTESIKLHLNNLRELLPHLKHNKEWTSTLDNIFLCLESISEKEFNKMTKEILSSKYKKRKGK